MMTSAAFALILTEERRREHLNKTVSLTHRRRVTVPPPAGSRDDDDILTETLRGPSPIPVASLLILVGAGGFWICRFLLLTAEGRSSRGGGGGEAMTPAGLLDEDR